MWKLWVINRKEKSTQVVCSRENPDWEEKLKSGMPVQLGKEEGKEMDTTEAPCAFSSVACFTHNLIYGADQGKYKEKAQHSLTADWNGETRDTVKRNTPLLQVWATKSETKRNREMRKWNWFYIKKYVSDFRVVKSEISEEQHLSGNVQ